MAVAAAGARGGKSRDAASARGDENERLIAGATRLKTAEIDASR